MEGIGSMKINDRVKVMYLGQDDPLTLMHGKIYDARVLKLGWLGIVDETHEEYAYMPELFLRMDVKEPYQLYKNWHEEAD